MQVHQIKFKLKKKNRVGRGGKRGSYSGRGIKGQKARAGRRIRPALRDVILKFPKKRGWANIKIEKNILEVNLEKINEKFQPGEIVSPETLKEKKILRIPKSLKNFQIKILGQGDLTKSLIFDHRLIFSRSAREKIENSNSKIQ
ncbi:MAG: 50S ribosomal protein L15 [Candidatus Parcubacteria bacterium]|nr:MAG: 50S ribosomal protein L15 [Candidatus Parcubacteria bacterium]